MKSIKTRYMSAAALCFGLAMILLSPGSGAAQERETLDFLLNEEEKADFLDLLNTSEAISKEAQDKLNGFMSHWQTLKDNFPNLPPAVQDLINRIEGEGLSSKVNQTLSGLQKFDSGVGKFKNLKEKADTVVNFYDRYRPDSENPFRSLEVLNNLFEDLEKLLGEEDKYEAVKNTTVWLTRTALRYFREGVKNAHDGLKVFQSLVRERGGDECLGFRGGDAVPDRRDPKRFAFESLNTGEIICYIGVRPIGGEVWCNETGNAVFVWDGRSWTRLSTGRAVTESIFSLWRLAHGRTIPVADLIDWSNNRMSEFVEFRDRAGGQYARLAGMNICQEKILEKMLLKEDLEDLMTAVQRDRQRFIAAYVFDVGEIRGLGDALVDAVTGFALVNGEVRDQDGDAPIGNAEVAIETGTRRHSAMTDNNGRFELILAIPLSQQASYPRLTITVKASGYAESKVETRLQSQCWDMGWFRLTTDEPAPVTILFLTPSEAELKIGQSITFRVNAERKDGTVESVPIPTVQFSGAPGGVFSAVEGGTFTVTASYEGRSASATIRVEAEDEPEEEDIEKVIEEIAEDEDDDPCSMDHIRSLYASLDGLRTEIRRMNAEFQNYAAKFNQEVNRQLADPCANQLLAYCYANAVDLATRIEVLLERVQDIATEIIMLQGICPDLGASMTTEGLTVNNLLAGLSGLGASRNSLDAMRSRLRESACDENEVLQNGTQLVPPGLDPDFVQDGGIMQEIPGDGVDNDGDGLQDENVTPLAGYNVTFVLYDSGRLKDDIFGLAVSAYGNLGTTPAGGLRSYGLNLSPGTYTAIVTVISAPDNVGTYTLVILQDGEPIASASGAPPQGASISVPFTVR